MPKYQKPVLNFNADDVWTAACFAQRTNGCYIKNADAEEWKGQAVDTNRQLVDKVISGEYAEQITDEDRKQGKKVRQYFQGFTFKILKGIKLSEFDNTAMLIANRDIITSSYDVAVIASLPSCYERSIKRDIVDQRITFATGGYVGCPGDKVTHQIEVLKCFYSEKWDTHYVTGITEAEQVFFFAYKNPIDLGSTIKIQGTVKAHRDNSTQLNRIKVI
jgi:hypothetical protein